MKKTLLDQVLDWSGRALVAAILGFVMLPFIVVALASFNDSAILSFPPENWSLRWYGNAFGYSDFGDGLLNSLRIAAFGATIALVAGAGFAYALDRYAFPGKAFLNGVLMSPLIIPNFTIGLGLLILSAAAGIPRTMWLVIAVHVIIVLPFVVRSVYVSLRNFDRAYETAAESLGASPRRTLLTVTLPLLLPGLISGGLFAAILSFNEFTASLFVVSQRTQTLPVAMYNYVREYADPTLAAVSVIYVVTVALILLVVHKIFRLEKVLNVE
ncbi:ABC transporter permease [Pelagibacterium halotolerans]|uniref:ABC-type transporter, permease component: POPT family n=1 Tax=Pelagibacterium halotolerans (strain DSM 22347 / JCM 15775 / CGMCC 1.7692 / B2) TaxID=1082931 RepID=G4RCG2_PELHB|nr:ABC transporter permease [Pelagibacterium halotolerans]AEQ53756.1 ABC-type transporter, permease component: POPT family [Pelagibacterium halotolerans B2]QJR20084.1 ABC transporter permease [Pelagibacterium halotolerans]SEA80337.1 putative spermidine/putrescine transport system permease protein [Pelagibacterium halotolerans]